MSEEPFLVEVEVEPKSKGDLEKLGVALNCLASEAPSFRVSVDHESGRTVIKGRDELHLEIIVDRLRREFKVEVNVGAPEVAYRETITKVKEHDYTQKKPAGRHQFARVKIRFEALPPGSGFVFQNDAPGGAVPHEYLPGVERGLHLARESGVIAGFPVVDFKATLIDGAHHDVDSNVMSFEIATRACFREAIPQAGPKLLEPMMKVEVVTREEYLGDVIGDLNSRRGQITGMETRGRIQIVTAIAPLANMFGYVNDLLRMTQGHAEYEMQFDRYQQVPLLPSNGGDNFPGAIALREGARLA